MMALDAIGAVLADERISEEQRATLRYLTNDGEHNVSYAHYYAADSWLMPGYLEVEIRGITYGISREGEAST
jgi:hypothetical protein